MRFPEVTFVPFFLSTQATPLFRALATLRALHGFCFRGYLQPTLQAIRTINIKISSAQCTHHEVCSSLLRLAKSLATLGCSLAYP